MENEYSLNNSNLNLELNNQDEQAKAIDKENIQNESPESIKESTYSHIDLPVGHETKTCNIKKLWASAEITNERLYMTEQQNNDEQLSPGESNEQSVSSLIESECYVTTQRLETQPQAKQNHLTNNIQGSVFKKYPVAEAS